MNKIKRIFQWIAINGICGGLVYATLFTSLKTNRGMVNITELLLWGWALFAWPVMLIAILAAIGASPKDKNKVPEHLLPVPRWVSVTCDFAVVLMLAYSGWIWTSVAWLFHIFAQSVTAEALKAAFKKQNPGMDKTEANPVPQRA